MQADTARAFQNDRIDSGSGLAAIRRSILRAGLPIEPPADWIAPRGSPIGPARLAERNKRVADIAANPFWGAAQPSAPPRPTSTLISAPGECTPQAWW